MRRHALDDVLTGLAGEDVAVGDELLGRHRAVDDLVALLRQLVGDEILGAALEEAREEVVDELLGAVATGGELDVAGVLLLGCLERCGDPFVPLIRRAELAGTGPCAVSRGPCTVFAQLRIVCSSL